MFDLIVVPFGRVHIVRIRNSKFGVSHFVPAGEIEKALSTMRKILLELLAVGVQKP